MTTFIGGLASGLDTASMIQQLLALERAPIERLEASRSRYQATDSVWTDVSTRLSGLRSALQDLSDGAGLDGFLSAKSSAPNLAGASITGAVAPQTITFTVDRLAARHELVSAGDFASADSLLGPGTFSLVVGGDNHDIVTDASTTLADLAASINDLGLGVAASVLTIDGSAVKLRLIANEVGEDHVFTTSSDLTGLDSTLLVRNGEDAQITMGALSITSDSNTLAGLVPGLNINLLASGAGEVTITIERDADSIVEAVTEVVDQLNRSTSRLEELMSYNPSTRAAGLLLGDGTARRILFDLQSSVGSVVVPGGIVSHLAEIGIETQRDGTVSLDETKLRAALESSYEDVGRLLTRWGVTTDPVVGYAGSDTDTVDGTYAVVVTQAASTASITGAAYSVPGSAIGFQITSGSKVADATVNAGAGLAEAVDAINAGLAAAGVTTVLATVDAGAIRLVETRYGSGPGFSVTGSGALGLDGAHQGTDVAGTIGGEAATGIGRRLTADSGAPAGLAVEVLATEAEVLGAGGTLAAGDVTVGGGLFGAVDRALDAAEGANGSIARARDHTRAQIDLMNDSIERFEDRLIGVEETLIRQFSVMEQLLAQLSSQQAWLQSQLASLTPPQ